VCRNVPVRVQMCNAFFFYVHNSSACACIVSVYINDAHIPRSLHVGAPLYQHPHCLKVALRRGDVERRSSSLCRRRRRMSPCRCQCAHPQFLPRSMQQATPGHDARCLVMLIALICSTACLHRSPLSVLRCYHPSLRGIMRHDCLAIA
jgi:hypothetical protein